MNALYDAIAFLSVFTVIMVLMGLLAGLWFGLDKFTIWHHNWNADREFRKMRKNLDRATPAK